MSARRALARSLVVGLILSVLLAGCTIEKRDDAPADPPSSVGEAPTETPISAARPLSADWYEDPDGDVVPTHTERQIGTDPLANDCVKDLSCPGLDVRAQGVRRDPRQNTLLMLDSSGSMRGSAGGGRTKAAAAKESLARYVVGTPDRVDLGLLVYGHKGSSREADKAESCRGSELLAPLGEVDYRNVDRELDRFEPRGFTPVAGALRAAQRAFGELEGRRNRVVLVSDGLETCGGDPVAAARRLKQAGIAVTVDVVGFDIRKETDAARLKEIADVTGGDYTSARSGDDLEAFAEADNERIAQENRAYSCLVAKNNDLYSCQTGRINDAYSDMTSEINASYSGLTSRVNGSYSRLTSESNAAYSAGDEARSDQIEGRRDRIDDELEARRTRLDTAMTRIRESMDDRLEAERTRDDAEAQGLKRRLERDARQVERRLQERYGRQSGLDPLGSGSRASLRRCGRGRRPARWPASALERRVPGDRPLRDRPFNKRTDAQVARATAPYAGPGALSRRLRRRAEPHGACLLTLGRQAHHAQREQTRGILSR